MGADFHLLAFVGAHRRHQLRRLLATRALNLVREIVDRGARSLFVALDPSRAANGSERPAANGLCFHSPIRLICRGSTAGAFSPGFCKSSKFGSKRRISRFKRSEVSQISYSSVQRAQAPLTAPGPSTAGL